QALALGRRRTGLAPQSPLDAAIAARGVLSHALDEKDREEPAGIPGEARGPHRGCDAEAPSAKSLCTRRPLWVERGTRPGGDRGGVHARAGPRTRPGTRPRS